MEQTVAVQYLCKSTKIVAGKPVVLDGEQFIDDKRQINEGREKTLAYKILRAHERNCGEMDSSDSNCPQNDKSGITLSGREKPCENDIPEPAQSEQEKLRIKFDALVSHDITYVGIIQTARASGLTEFPIPYALTNCHNSLCAVGGTIN